MQKLLLWIGRIGGLGGVFLCVIAVGARIAKIFYFAGFQVGTVLQGGMAAMLLACLAYAAAIAERSRE